MRGYAPTQIPADGMYDTDTLGQDALALITALGHSQAIVVGHDWGAGAAYCAAGLGPSALRFLVTVAIPHPAGVLPTPQLVWSVRHFLSLRLPGAATRIRAGNLAHLEELRQRWSPAWNIPPIEPQHTAEALLGQGHLEAALGYYRSVGLGFSHGMMQRVTVPAAAFAGLGDMVAVGAYHRAARRYTAAYEVVTMPGGHFMHREHPEVFAQHLLRVLEPYRA